MEHWLVSDLRINKTNAITDSHTHIYGSVNLEFGIFSNTTATRLDQIMNQNQYFITAFLLKAIVVEIL